MHCACKYQMYTLVFLLVHLQARPDVQDSYGYTPLMSAIMNYAPVQLVKMLANHDTQAHINLKNKYG